MRRRTVHTTQTYAGARVYVTFNSVNENNHFVTKYGSFECAHNITFDGSVCLFPPPSLCSFFFAPNSFSLLFIAITEMFILFSYIQKYFFDRILHFTTDFPKCTAIDLKISFSYSINKISAPALYKPRNKCIFIYDREVYSLKHWIKHIANEMEEARVNIEKPTASIPFPWDWAVALSKTKMFVMLFCVSIHLSHFWTTVS